MEKEVGGRRCERKREESVVFKSCIRNHNLSSTKFSL